MIELTPTVAAMLNDDHAPTAPLDDFLADYAQDDNLWWRLSCGHHQNLFEAALEADEETAAAYFTRLQ